MKDFLTFKTYITPMLIKTLFWLFLLAILILSYRQLSLGTAHRMAGLRLLILGPIALRIVCEIVLVYFNQYRLLQQIQQQTQSRQ